MHLGTQSQLEFRHKDSACRSEDSEAWLYETGKVFKRSSSYEGA